MNAFEYQTLGQMIDIHAAHFNITLDEVNQMIQLVQQYDCVSATPLPYFIRHTIYGLGDRDDIIVSGLVNYLTDLEPIYAKQAQARKLIALGCEELDIMMDMQAFKKGAFESVITDVKSIRDSSYGVPIKATLDINKLNESELKRASELMAIGGATMIKLGTEWDAGIPTARMVRAIRESIGNSAKIQVTNGVAKLSDLVALEDSGCNRISLDVRTATTILEEIFQYAENPLKCTS